MQREFLEQFPPLDVYLAERAFDSPLRKAILLDGKGRSAWGAHGGDAYEIKGSKHGGEQGEDGGEAEEEGKEEEEEEGGGETEVEAAAAFAAAAVAAVGKKSGVGARRKLTDFFPGFGGLAATEVAAVAVSRTTSKSNKVGPRRLTVSKPRVKARLVSALNTEV